MKKISLLMLSLSVIFVGLYAIFFSNFSFKTSVALADSNLLVHAEKNDIKKEIFSINSIGKDIYLDSDNINSTILVYKSNFDLSSYGVKSSCNIVSDFIKNIKDKYFFKVVFLDNSCKDNKLYLSIKNLKLENSDISINFIRKEDLLLKYIDFSDNLLDKLVKSLDERIKKYSLYKDVNFDSGLNYIKYLEKNILYRTFLYKKEIIEYIILERSKKYIMPVPGYKISTKHSKLPNTGRPYRGSYTDGVHHGWDIDAPLGTEVVALSNGIIMRETSDFTDADLQKIIYSNLDEEYKLKNLDLLRGKQVWLKTLKGDVVFYAHLSEIYEDIKPGTFVTVGTKLGKIGVSGIPGKAYNDYHLHFAIQKNPYNVTKAGKYNSIDYMKWDWYYKGESIDYIIKNEASIFEI